MATSCCTWRMSGKMNEHTARVIDLDVALAGISFTRTIFPLESMRFVTYERWKLSVKYHANRSHCLRSDGIDNLKAGCQAVATASSHIAYARART